MGYYETHIYQGDPTMSKNSKSSDTANLPRLRRVEIAIEKLFLGKHYRPYL